MKTIQKDNHTFTVDYQYPKIEIKWTSYNVLDIRINIEQERLTQKEFEEIGALYEIIVTRDYDGNIETRHRYFDDMPTEEEIDWEIDHEIATALKRF